MKKKGKELEEAGYDQDAKKCYNRSVQITAEMIDVLIDLLQMMHFEVIVAPYEADAQVAFLVKEGIADFAISEDSDLIVFGCP